MIGPEKTSAFDASHHSVMLAESIEALVSNPDGLYVDGTFGRGGHSRAILAQLSNKGRLLVFDKDPEAIAEAKQWAAADERVSVCHASFAALSKALPQPFNEAALSGVLLDLGVSSPQLDQAPRGFSFNKEGPLDMRMDNSQGITAADWLNEADESEIAKVLKEYGEERFAGRMARAVVKVREVQPLETTAQFAEVISAANPRWEKGKHPATRAFQAVRIFINQELDDLLVALHASVDRLAAGGRLVVISFHSLEDRIVKRFFRDQSRGKQFPPGLPVSEAMLERTLRLIKKAQRATTEEITQNIRSRSAVLRVAERLSRNESESKNS